MRNRRGRAAIAALGLLAQLLPGAASVVKAAEPVAFSYTGAEQQYVVPDGVTSIHVVLVGGAGDSSPSAPGGFGARVEGDVSVVPGQSLAVWVGGNGGGLNWWEAGFNGGGRGVNATWQSAGGGGASDLRTGLGLDTRLMVAGGGGGGGASWSSAVSGAGGNAGSAGADAGAATGGEPGGVAAGGAGGLTGGASGSFGVGGAGSGTNSPGAGGGGGGGYYGGGGGGAGAGANGAGGGGGGSSYSGNASNATVGVDTTGVPSITISYALTTNNGTVSAQVAVAPSAACLELESTSVDFGTLPLGASLAAGTPEIQITNCSSLGETILVSGTDAVGADATWNLIDFTTCADAAVGIDNYGLALRLTPDADLALLETNQELAFLPAAAISAFDALISTACPGSAGGGTTMTMQIVFVATEVTP